MIIAMMTIIMNLLLVLWFYQWMGSTILVPNYNPWGTPPMIVLTTPTTNYWLDVELRGHSMPRNASPPSPQRDSMDMPVCQSTYCQRKSDPVPDGVQLHPTTKIVLLEGNYLLAWDDARWAPLQTNNVFDEMWYIGCKSLDEQREGLVKRHLETWSEVKTKMWGKGEVGVGAKADANDMLNVGWIEDMSSRKYADLVIES